MSTHMVGRARDSVATGEAGRMARARRGILRISVFIWKAPVSYQMVLSGMCIKNRIRLGGKTVGPVIAGKQVMNDGSFISGGGYRNRYRWT